MDTQRHTSLRHRLLLLVILPLLALSLLVPRVLQWTANPSQAEHTLESLAKLQQPNDDPEPGFGG